MLMESREKFNRIVKEFIGWPFRVRDERVRLAIEGRQEIRPHYVCDRTEDLPVGPCAARGRCYARLRSIAFQILQEDGLAVVVAEELEGVIVERPMSRCPATI